MITYVYISGFLVEFRLFDLSVCSCLRRIIKAIYVMKYYGSLVLNLDVQVRKGTYFII